MKKLFVIICALFVGFAYAANENVPTSKKFVDNALAQKQPKFDGLGNDKLMLYSNTTDGVVASRDIVTTLGNSTSANTVPTVGAINAGLATKQDTLNGDAGWVAENTGIAGAVVQKPIYSTTNNYSNALVEVETLNNAVINAVNSELTVVPGVGWTINTADNLNLLSVPNTYSQILPNGYTQLEYLESTGTQYIDTEILLTSEKAKVEITASGFGGNGMYGAQDAPNTNSAILVYDNRLYVGTLEGRHFAISLFNEASAPLSTVILDANSGNIKITNYLGNTINLTYSGSIVSHNTWTIGKMNSANGPSGGFVGKIQSVQIWDNNICVGNFISTRRDSDGELGMYDTVSNTFFTNSGTGEFIAGPAVNTYLPQGN